MRIDTNNWCGLRRNERNCQNCDNAEVDDVESTLHCSVVIEDKIEMERQMNEMVEGWKEIKDDERVAWLLDGACRDGSVERSL